PSRALVPCLATSRFGLVMALSCLACAPVRAPAIVEIGLAAGALASPGDAVPEAEAQAAKGPGCSWDTGLVSARGDALPLCFAVDSACFAHVSSPAQGRVTAPAGDPATSGARASFLVD